MVNLIKQLLGENVSNKKKIEVINKALKITNNNNIFAGFDKEGHISLVSIDECLYIIKPKRNIFLIGTMEKEIEFKSSPDFLDLVERNYPDFVPMGNNISVNITKVTHYDSYYHRVYFGKDKYVSVTGTAINKVVKKYFKDKSFDLHYKEGRNNIEYSPLIRKTKLNYTR